mgnify:CR=1 FL=1
MQGDEQCGGGIRYVLGELEGTLVSHSEEMQAAGANIAAMAVLASDADRRKRIAGFMLVHVPHPRPAAS